MAFFKFRLPGQSGAEAHANLGQSAPPSVDVMRRRARHRLFGTALLVLIAVVVFSIVFDTQPRPISSDVRIDIPDRDNVKPLAVSPAAVVEASASLSEKEELVTDPPAAKSKVAPAAPVQTSTPALAPASVTKVENKSENKTESKPVETKSAANATRYIVQVGAFADEAKSKEVRARLEKAGLKTYTHIAETKEGRRIRVRLGPFTNREEADKVASKIKQLQLQPQILTL
jgi:DedD protein